MLILPPLLFLSLPMHIVANADTTGGLITLVTFVRDAFLETAEPTVARKFLNGYSTTMQALTSTSCLTKDHNYVSPERPRCGFPQCEGCYNRYVARYVSCTQQLTQLCSYFSILAFFY